MNRTSLSHTLLLLLVLVSIVSGAYLAIAGPPRSGWPPPPAAAAAAPASPGFAISGTLLPKRRVDLSVPDAGTVSALPVPEGGAVRQGDVVVELAALAEHNEVQRVRAAIRAAETALEAAEARRLALGPDASGVVRAVADGDVALAASEVERLGADLAVAEATLDGTRLKAPFDGTLVALDIEVGQRIGRDGGVVARIADVSDWRVEATGLTERAALALASAGSVVVILPGIPELFLPGHLLHVVPQGEAATDQSAVAASRYTATVDLDASDPRLQWGLKATITAP